MKLSCNERFLTGKRSSVEISYTRPAVYMWPPSSFYTVLPLILLLLQNTERPSIQSVLKINFNIIIAPKTRVVFSAFILLYICIASSCSLPHALCQLPTLVTTMEDYYYYYFFL